jgi:hypothetical protein
MKFDEFSGTVWYRLELADTGESVRAIRATLIVIIASLYRFRNVLRVSHAVTQRHLQPGHEHNRNNQYDTVVRDQFRDRVTISRPVSLDSTTTISITCVSNRKWSKDFTTLPSR